MPVEPEVIDAEVIGKPPARERRGVPASSLPARVLASNGGAWFAWGFIGGLLFAGAAVYVIKKRM